MIEVTLAEPRAFSPDTRKLLVAMGHKLGDPQPANHVAAMLFILFRIVGAGA